jgi:predicted lysophospholipase L1 biosynthesis ABC-type transport system permease subunit
MQAGVVSCAQLAEIPGYGRCPAGAVTAAFPASLFRNLYLSGYHVNQTLAKVTWPAANVTAAQLAALPLDSLNVATNGSTSAIEQARTVLDQAYPFLQAPRTLGDKSSAAQIEGYEQLFNVVILASLVIAGCALAASVVGGLADRKRPFSLLRLTGARLAMLRRVVTLEAVVPLLATAAVCIGIGFAASAMYAAAELHHPLVAPGTGYYALTAAGIVAALAILVGTFPLLARITGPEVARND